jgi:DNA-binding LacI/PurR family transcriptional regulator
VLALGALREARRRGLDVPGQLTVTGFDGVPQALAEGLTTVLQPVEEKGRAAGRLLLEPREAGGTGAPRTVLLPTTLELGRTSSSPQQPKWFSGL